MSYHTPADSLLLLTENEQGLLRAALTSNTDSVQPNRNISTQRIPTEGPNVSWNTSTTDRENSHATMGFYSADMYKSPDQATPASGHFDGLGEDTSPLLDFDLEDGSFDWDNSGMIGDLPALSAEDNNDQHDKRKKSTDEEGGDEGTGKRREGEDKGSARKPGRKPLTGEPTTKRKAQNRAAQRAFRERKERHLKDLEMKVEDLEKASESTNHENGRLRAQVERLNTEVKEYRKRLSMTAPGLGRSPPTASPMPYSNYIPNNNDFQFAFPKFGDLPGSIFGSNGSLAKVPSPTAQSNPSFDRGSNSSVPSLARSSLSQSPTTKSPMSINGNYGTTSGPNIYRSPSRGMSGASMEELNGLFSPSILESASRNAGGDYGFSNPVTHSPAPGMPRKSSSMDSYNNALANTPNFNSTSTGSPSVSSLSHTGQESSCGTTPEPSADSPEHRKQSEGTLNTISEETREAVSPSTSGKVKFCSEWAKACGNIANPVPKALLGSNGPSAKSSTRKSPELNNGIDWLAQQNGGQFDPVLFGDYRDPQENIMSSGFASDFFSDAFLAQDFGTPFNTGEPLSDPQPSMSTPAPAHAKPDLMKQVEAAQDTHDDPEVVPGEKPKQFIACDKLWDRVQASEKVHSGEVDMDELCSQLKQKAKCSGKGAVIDQADVDKILGPLSGGQKAVSKQFI